MIAILVVAGMFTLGLGIWHLGVPRWFDFATAVGSDSPDRPGLRTIGVGGLRHRTTRRDVLGIAWVMNLAASYVLVTIGIVDLAAAWWLGTGLGRVVAAWIAGWWTIRTVMQLSFGRRPIDVACILLFGALAAVHLVAAAS
jgi:hypothetical protein